MKHKLALSVKLATSIVLAVLFLPASGAATPETEQDRSPDALQARLDEAEKNYKGGKIDTAIEQAKSLVGVTDSSFFQSDRVAQDAQVDLALFQLKAGQPDQSAFWIRKLLLTLQLASPMDPQFATNTAEVLGRGPQALKDYFAKVSQRLGEKPDTMQIIDSLVDNTVPKDYSAQLKAYCERMQKASHELRDIESIASIEELKYGDSLTLLDGTDSANKSDPSLSAERLDKLAKSLDALALEAQQMPVGDLRASIDLYKLALVANSAQRYEQAETFANQCIAHARALTETANLPDVRIALAYALVRQGRKTEFTALRDALLKDTDVNERRLVALARLTELSGDDSGASAIYKRALDNRNKSDKQPPEWMNAYNMLLKKVESSTPQ